MEVRDLWPDSIIAVGALKEGVIISLLRRIETFLYRHADWIVSVSPGFVEYFADRGLRDKLSVVTNGVDLVRFSPGKAVQDLYASHGIREPFRILYSGTIGMAHGLEIVLDAAERLADCNCALVIVGDGARRTELMSEAVRRQLNNVYFLPMQSRATMPDWIRGADAALVHLRRSGLFETVLPSKLFEYMGCARPVLMGVAGTAAALVREASCGWEFPSDDAEALAHLGRYLSEHPDESQRRGQAGRKYVELHYDRDRLAQRYLNEVLIPIAEGRTA
jgi:glycosyltransferase involved in cell wall biosynthesis